MASGSKSIKVTGFDTLKFSWEEKSQSIPNNSTVVSWKMELIAGSSGKITSSVSKKWRVTVNGVKYSGTNTIGIANNSTKTLASGSTTIAHNTDGTKTFSYSFYQQFEGLVFAGDAITDKSGSGSGVLTNIPRAATITSAPNFNDEANPVITYSNPAGSAVDSLEACISLTGAADDIAYRSISKTGTSYTFNLTDAERNVLRNATKNDNSRSVRFYIQTTINGEVYRKHIEKTLTIINANPTVNPTVYDSRAATIELTGDNNKFVRYYSSAAFDINPSAKKGATIEYQKITVKGKSSFAENGTISNVEDAYFVFTAGDSRGNTVSRTIEKTLIPYVRLTCNMAVEAPTTDGKLTLKASGNYFNGTFGAVANTLTVQYRYKEGSGSYSAWTAATATKSGNTYTATVNITGLDYQKTYTFQCRAIDKLATVESAAKAVKTTPVFDWGSDDFAFNVPVSFNAGYTADNKVLWQGSYYMTAGQTANLNDAVSNQATGIVLIFSRYDIANSSPLNEHFSYHFVPKQIVQLHGGKGSVFSMSTSNQSFFANKYLYINDESIEGHDNNGTYGTGDSGINYNNNRFVLRYVIGV